MIPYFLPQTCPSLVLYLQRHTDAHFASTAEAFDAVGNTRTELFKEEKGDANKAAVTLSAPGVKRSSNYALWTTSSRECVIERSSHARDCGLAIIAAPVSTRQD